MDIGRGQASDARVSGRTIHLSLVIPAFNEAARLPATLADVLAFLGARDYRWEVVIADDGSSDDTAAAARASARGDERVRVLRLPHQGKAAAVRAGIAAARGDYVIFTDADLSTPIAHVDEALSLLEAGWDIVIGTREGSGALRLGEPVYRHLMGRIYNLAVRAIVVRGIRDTQCGFKGFRAEVARDLFSRALLYAASTGEVRGPMVTGFDVELLFLARKRGYRLYELPVTWRHVDGSKVRPGIDSLRMLRDVLRVRMNDLRGRYDGEPAARPTVESAGSDH